MAWSWTWARRVLTKTEPAPHAAPFPLPNVLSPPRDGAPQMLYMCLLCKATHALPWLSPLAAERWLRA